MMLGLDGKHYHSTFMTAFSSPLNCSYLLWAVWSREGQTLSVCVSQSECVRDLKRKRSGKSGQKADHAYDYIGATIGINIPPLHPYFPPEPLSVSVVPPSVLSLTLSLSLPSTPHPTPPRLLSSLLLSRSSSPGESPPADSAPFSVRQVGRQNDISVTRMVRAGCLCK